MCMSPSVPLATTITSAETARRKRPKSVGVAGLWRCTGSPAPSIGLEPAVLAGCAPQ